MAMSHQIARADHHGTGKSLDTFTDDSIIPATLRECASDSEELGLTLRAIRRNSSDREDLRVLLDEILGEG